MIKATKGIYNKKIFGSPIPEWCEHYIKLIFLDKQEKIIKLANENNITAAISELQFIEMLSKKNIGVAKVFYKFSTSYIFQK